MITSAWFSCAVVDQSLIVADRAIGGRVLHDQTEDVVPDPATASSSNSTTSIPNRVGSRFA